VIGLYVAPDGKTAAIVEVNCETDFVGKNDDFKAFAAEVAKIAAHDAPADLAALAARTLASGETIEARRVALVQKIGENLSLRRFARRVAQCRIASYVHGTRIGVIVDVTGGNETLGKDLLGLEPHQVVGKRFPELPYPPELANRLQSELDEVVRTGRQVKGDTYYKSPTGKEGWYEYIFNPVLAANGAVASIAGSTRNVTVRQEQERRLTSLHESERQAREEAERAGRLKDEFLATLSHELRTPLQAIQGWADLLRSGRLPAEQIQKVGDRISRNARTQGQLIADLLDMNGIVSGKVRLAIERVAIAKPIAAAIEAVRMDAAGKTVVIQGPAPGPLPELDCDPDRIQQVIWNLLANAIKFTPSGGRIGVSIEHGDSDVAVLVSDTGAGISAEFLPRLFERFSQADSSSTRKYGGLGLGLSICKSLVELHGGHISPRAAAKGKARRSRSGCLSFRPSRPSIGCRRGEIWKTRTCRRSIRCRRWQGFMSSSSTMTTKAARCLSRPCSSTVPRSSLPAAPRTPSSRPERVSRTS